MAGVEPPDGPVERVARARAARSAGETVAAYREWASRDDDDVFRALGFTGSARIADLLASHVDERDGAILDLGCGTGAVGERLQLHGFGVIDGVDLSPEMLRVAAAKRCYRGLLEVDLERGLPFADGAYAAAVSAGTFTAGGVGPGAVAEVLRVLRPGAVVAWVIGTWTAFEPVVSGWDVVHLAAEPIRRDGPPEATMMVAHVGRW